MQVIYTPQECHDICQALEYCQSWDKVGPFYYDAKNYSKEKTHEPKEFEIYETHYNVVLRSKIVWDNHKLENKYVSSS